MIYPTVTFKDGSAQRSTQCFAALEEARAWALSILRATSIKLVDRQTPARVELTAYSKVNGSRMLKAVKLATYTRADARTHTDQIFAVGAL
jgi:hypothetical protein